MKKRIALLVTAVVLCAAVTVGATLAYLWDSDEAITNIFTVGDVDVELTEEFYIPDGSEKAPINGDLKLLPGTKFGKNPTVKLGTDSEDAYVYIMIEYGMDLDVFSTHPVVNTPDVWEKVAHPSLLIYRAALSKTESAKLYTTDKFVVNSELVAEELSAIVDAEGEVKITYSAYAIQSDNITIAEADAAAIAFFA